MAPIVSIVGHSNSGKTTLIEKLVRELTSRGYRVATIKHTHETVADMPEKDTCRHLKAGSKAAGLSTSDRLSLVMTYSREMTVAEIGRFFGEDYDIILTEGFKTADAPKIEVCRRETGPPLRGITRRLAIVTAEELETEVRRFSPDDVGGLTDLLESGYIIPQVERISLHVNGKPVVLTSFPRRIIASIITSLVASLKGVGEITGLDINLRRKR